MCLLKIVDFVHVGLLRLCQLVAGTSFKVHRECNGSRNVTGPFKLLSLQHRWSTDMLRVLFRVAYKFAGLFPCMCSVMLSMVTMMTQCVPFVCPILLVCFLVLQILCNVALRFVILSFHFQTNVLQSVSWPYGGAGRQDFAFNDIAPYVVQGDTGSSDNSFRFVVHDKHISTSDYDPDVFVYTNVPVRNIVRRLPIKSILNIAHVHGMKVSSHVPKSIMVTYFDSHHCATCNDATTIFSIVRSRLVRDRNRKRKPLQADACVNLDKAGGTVTRDAAEPKQTHPLRTSLSTMEAKPTIEVGRGRNTRHRGAKQSRKGRAIASSTKDKVTLSVPEFPPSPPDNKLQCDIARDFCFNSSPDKMEEGGCAVCGQLTSTSQLSRLKYVKQCLSVLHAQGITRVERKCSSKPIHEYKGPVLDYKCDRVCDNCRKYLRKGQVPRNALATGLWIGAIPDELSSLKFMERLLIARVRINSCFVRVAASGLKKMTSHVIAFESPVQKVYHRLPPPIEELGEILAILFTGPCSPTDKVYRRTPLLVRRSYVARALEWLKLNNIHYADLDIAYDELEKYPEHVPPVTVEYRYSMTTKIEEGTSSFDTGEEVGVDDGECPFVVHGLMDDKYETMSVDALKGIALRHWNNGGGALAVSHSSKSKSIYNDTTLYPQAFPWLFPYGLGGVGTANLSDTYHKRFLLMYHDKRFQTDAMFPFVAFSHMQLKAASTAGFLLADSSKFRDITNRLLSVNQETLASISKRLSEGEAVKPSTEDEKSCFQLVRDLDHINGKVQGSITSKKYMRSEIWSLIAYLGAPMWYITLSPADNKHPICIYFADNKESFDVKLNYSDDDRFRLIANNPVAGARFFHFMVDMFISHVLGFGKKRRGLYGDTSAFYGTVEQQGRLTLHLHMLLWIRGTLPPEDMRRKILDPSSNFRDNLVKYLEGTHAGDFMSASLKDVEADVREASGTKGYKDPTEMLPEAPPLPCSKNECNDCEQCTNVDSWWLRFRRVVNALLFRSNVHKCSSTRNKDGSRNKGCAFIGCLDNVYGKCKARFPRPIYEHTQVDLESGSMLMKKMEQWLNTFSYLVTYLLRCNTDVTSLRSGTAIKSVLLYVTNYVTKAPLKTYAVFDTIRSIFDKNPDVVGGSDSMKEKARKLMTKIVNSLSAKMEMGNPMICMYILGNPDHYKSHDFRVFYWMSFVNVARSPWLPSEVDSCGSKGDLNIDSTPLGSNLVKDEQPDTDSDELSGIKRSKEKVTILKYNDRFIGLSPVHDYIYRCESLRDMCLYDWVARCERTKLPKGRKKNTRKQRRGEYGSVSEAESPVEECLSFRPEVSVNSVSATKSNVFRFLPDHPLANSHGTRCRSVCKEKVPNFVGRTLPRCDQGDREFYCSVMLTLFKPWRSGLDLKTRAQSWDDAFSTHKFLAKHMDVMRNLHIRYECLDARDDFHAQLTRGDSDVEFSSWESQDKEIMQDMDINEIYVDDGINLTQDDSNVERHVSDFSYELGKREIARSRLMSEMRATLQSIGWTDNRPDSLQPVVGIMPTPPGVKRNGAEWKTIVMQKRADVLQLRSQNMPAISDTMTGRGAANDTFLPDDVRVVKKSYLSRTFISNEWQTVIEDIISRFGLNREQARAFRIVANHVCDTDFEQLKMYIGGMAGTGKSQVLRALSEFFTRRKELHRLLILAPTGSAAALLGGSTYHSVLGINSDSDRSSNTSTRLSQIKTRLMGVRYIFLDEVSMLSCRDMYLISERLARILNNSDTPFGGMNMIFAGDFAQLPPAIGGEHASLYSRTAGRNATSLYDQQAAIGKALWHQVTTVVILRQNMRQRTESVEDSQFREALSNMRYKACTVTDIAFLRSRVSCDIPNRPSINDARFRNVSIITCLNSLKDEINRLGAVRFAQESNQNLVDFFSIDTLPSEDVKDYRGTRKRRVKRMPCSKFAENGKIKANVQTILWEQPPCANTKLVPGKLSLCVGMPVMIRNNVATELCITKGQEGFVYGWQSRSINGVDTLDTLFIQLHEPPTPVKFDELPLNVVPLSKSSVSTTCHLPDDSSLHISRSQIEVLPNFAMTDFASQGKTRGNNVVDLRYARSHQGYYTSLSRGTSAAGTLILGGFHPSKITGGASGALRQEFRELEFLDEITTLHYNSRLSMKIAMAERRNTQISLFRETMGLQYIPSNMHKAIRWNKRDPYVDSGIDDSSGREIDWRIVEPVSSANKIQLKSDISESDTGTNERITIQESSLKNKDCNPICLKRVCPIDTDTRPKTRAKKLKVSHTAASSANTHLPPRVLTPIGTQWQNNSCAYDAICTVLFNVWREDPAETTLSWNELHNNLLNMLTTDFNSHVDVRAGSDSPSCSLEQIRDFLRRDLAELDNDEFAFGRYASVHAIMNRLLTSREPVMKSVRHCLSNHAVDGDERFTNSCEIVPMPAGASTSATGNHSIQESMDNFSLPLSATCPECGNELVRRFSFASHPPLLCIELWQSPRLLDSILHIDTGGSRRQYKLRGVIYFSGEHFTSRVITSNGMIWFHDGMFTGNSLLYESLSISSIPMKDSTLAVYVREKH